jgi:thymidine phosphorylase
MGCRVTALITDMSQPLGRAVGNAVEVAESIEILKGRGPRDVESLSVELAAWMVHLGDRAASLDAARARVREALSSGQGLERFRRVIELQGGDPRVCDDPGRLPQAAHRVPLPASRDGRVARIGCRDVGRIAMQLGAGRERVEDRIDPAVGVVLHKKVGDLVIEGEPLATLHVDDPDRLAPGLEALRDAIGIGAEAPESAPLIRDVLDS